MRILISESQLKRLFLKENWDNQQQGRIDSLLKRKFGVTTNFGLCGWLLRDGSMLNFSYQGSSRDIDHRYINQANYDKDDNEICDFRFPNIYEFMEMGNIRMFPMEGFQLVQPPTPFQRTKLSQFIRRCDELYVDISDGRGSELEHFEWYDKRPNVEDVMRKIDNYFNSVNQQQSDDDINDHRGLDAIEGTLGQGQRFSTFNNEELKSFYGASIYAYIKQDRHGNPMWYVDEIQPTSKEFGWEERFLKDICSAADKHNVLLCFRVGKGFPKLKVALKSKRFYENSGRNKDYYYGSWDWLRKPQ